MRGGVGFISPKVRTIFESKYRGVKVPLPFPRGFTPGHNISACACVRSQVYLLESQVTKRASLFIFFQKGPCPVVYMLRKPIITTSHSQHKFMRSKKIIAFSTLLNSAVQPVGAAPFQEICIPSTTPVVLVFSMGTPFETLQLRLQGLDSCVHKIPCRVRWPES